MQLAIKLVKMGFSKGYSPNMEINLRDLERDPDDLRQLFSGRTA